MFMSFNLFLRVFIWSFNFHRNIKYSNSLFMIMIIKNNNITWDFNIFGLRGGPFCCKKIQTHAIQNPHQIALSVRLVYR